MRTKWSRFLSILSLFVICLLAIPSSAVAEWRTQLATLHQRQLASVASWVTIASVLVLDTQASIQNHDHTRIHNFERQGIRLGLTYGTVYLTKTLIHRNRPCAPSDCGIDRPNASFFSAHTAGAFQTLGGPRPVLILPLAISTGTLRVAAGKHWMSDTIVGAAVGLATSRIR